MCAVVCVWREGEGGLVGGIERRRDTGRDTCAAIWAQGVNLRANLLAHLRERERERTTRFIGSRGRTATEEAAGY